MDNVILYEFPLNEIVRVALRLEYVFAQAEFYSSQQDYWHNQAMLDSLVDLINILDRPDFKNKITQLLVIYHQKLKQELKTPTENTERTEKLFQKTEEAIGYLQSITGKLNQSLDNIEFLTNARLRFAKTNSLCNFDFPLYHYWLHQSDAMRKENLHAWLGQLSSVRGTIQILNTLIRRNAEMYDIHAAGGYYEHAFPGTIEYQLVRIYVPAKTQAYPEISVGKHRMNLNFYSMNLQERSKQYKEDIALQIALCS